MTPRQKGAGAPLGREGAYSGEERRVKPRIYVQFPVRVWSVDAEGRKFETEVPAVSLSASGVCVSLPRQVEVGEEMLVLVRFSTLGEETRPRVAAMGTVVRSSRRYAGPDRLESEWETAVRFSGHVVV